MLRHLLSVAILLACLAYMSVAQTSYGAGQAAHPPPPATAATKIAEAQEKPADNNSPKPKQKTKKVWTEDDVSKIGGGISVVGDPSTQGASKSSSKGGVTKSNNSAQNREIQDYREQLRQLQVRLEATDKKIEDLRNFKGENTTASGGINPHGRYTMTPIGDQIKQLEEKKKQIQEQIDAVTDEARKKGIEPGQLR